MQKILLLGAAGALGALSRYFLAGLVHRLHPSTFPWGTAVVNLTGCLLAGFLWSFFETRMPVSGQTRTVVMVGFMGAFTTFSTFVLETGELFRASQWAYAVFNLAFQNGVGLCALVAGIALGRLV
ncbi:MAG: CrcB family protein [Thermodesulfobacteriota bacterium]